MELNWGVSLGGSKKDEGVNPGKSQKTMEKIVKGKGATENETDNTLPNKKGKKRRYMPLQIKNGGEGSLGSLPNRNVFSLGIQRARKQVLNAQGKKKRGREFRRGRKKKKGERRETNL